MSKAPKISVLIYTARGDHPYVDTSWHCFDPVLKTLASQTMQDFELVLVDMHWHTRRNYFTEHPQPFPVKHVPASPNLWHSRRRTGLCAQINRGFAWADGELIWMGAENNLFPPGLLARAWEIHRAGTIPVAWYGICGIDAGAPHPDCPADFDLLGFTRAHVKDMDHRGKRFVEDKALKTSPCHHQNYFGFSSVPTAAAVAVNGFDELFDGQWGLFDCDFGSRLDLAGYTMTFARDLYVIEPPVAPGPYTGIGHQEAFKCHYAIYLHNRATGRRVNSPLPPSYIADVKATSCGKLCAIRDKCAAGAPGIGESRYYPFCESKDLATHELAAALLANPPMRNLESDRIARRAGWAPFDRGTFHAG